MTNLRSTFWLLAGLASASACYDTKLIDDDGERSQGGEAGAREIDENEAGTAGEPAVGAGGAPESDGGAPGNAGATLEGGTPAGGDAQGGGITGGRESGGRASGGSAQGGNASGGTSNGGSGGISNGGSGGISSGGTNAGTGGDLGTGGKQSGTGGTTPLPGVTWLSFDGSDAPASLEPNGELGINGQLYAYADDCATLEWDAETRCASGSLCPPGPNFQNWGIAVGFYFDTTGPDGDPPDLKRTWDPNEISAKGVGFRISGNAPAIQLWILNMDPAYAGECAEDSCEIIGPPDGTSTPKLQGTLSFGSLHKDDWNGSGIDYEFDPAAVHALQFKIPAVVAGEVPFAFCIDALGIVRD